MKSCSSCNLAVFLNNININIEDTWIGSNIEDMRHHIGNTKYIYIYKILQEVLSVMATLT